MGGFRLGRILGLEIRIDYSWLIIFFLVLWTFTIGVFPARYPGLDGWVYVVMGGIGTLLFFVSVLLHEMAHSLVAQSKGIPVDGITLFVFGGMAHTRSEFEEPGDEFVIAAAGPISSFLIAGIFGAVAWGGTRMGLSVAMTGVAGYLALLNLILAVFNLLPGFPLDGGRLFRAAVWKATGDLTRATRVATNGGKVLGYLLMGLGLLQIFAGAGIGGLWMIFIGWFVRLAADASYTQHLMRSSLDGIRAREAMSTDLQTVEPQLTLQDFVDRFVFSGRHEAYPVTDGDQRPLGIVTFRQVKGVPREQWPGKTIGETMTPLDEDSSTSPEARMTDVIEKIQKSKTRRVLVLDGERLVGIITAGDLARWLDRAGMTQRVSA